ncbi:MAG: UvrB/UvrC motif-containing protein [Candidatus Omnitrophica bacterium]|nr:UvrB/UvrC motif-containing protein [Candidatus Omnitrophota bacterium]MDD5487655.1 UvrB/UvrC motif-containing protein [Candidatus Omnitrophota bacterium]
MKCDSCGAPNATVHLTEVVNDKVTKMHLCDKCAKLKSEEMQSHFGLTDLLSGLMDFGAVLPDGQMSEGMMVQCPRCKMTYYDFQGTGRLGCGECYTAFSKNLNDLLRKIHGSDNHVGKLPFKGEAMVGKQKLYRQLKTELDRLVRAEEFEKAALVRDQIKEIENKLDFRE